MKIYRYVLCSFLLLSVFSINAQTSTGDNCDCEESVECPCEESPDCPCELDGAYSYKLSGNIGASEATTPYQEVGVITFDAETQTGCITATAVESGTAFQNISYSFNYIFIAPGLMRLTLTRNEGVTAIGGLQWVISYGQSCDHISLEFLPAPTIPSGLRFTNNQVIGSGGK